MQAGYLTIIGADEPMVGRWVYTLGFPNREVESSLNEALIPAFGLDAQKMLIITTIRPLRSRINGATL